MESKQSHKERRPNVNPYRTDSQMSGVDRKLTELEDLKRRHKHLKAVHELQNRTVRHFMHNVMSPLSAVSGYLELLSNNLNGISDNEKLTRYSAHIGDGLNEIGFLLEQIHDIYKDDYVQDAETESPVIEVNWLVDEVKNIVSNSSEIRASRIVFHQSETPVYVEAELFQIKLMLYNLVTAADFFSTTESTLEIEVEADETEFALIIRSSGDRALDDVFLSVFKDRDIVRLSDEMDEDSSVLLGLKICAQIAEQVGGHIIMDKRNRNSPQFVLTAPLAEVATVY